MECNYSFLQRYHIIYDQPKEQENVTFRIVERGIYLSIWYISFSFFIFSQFFFVLTIWLLSVIILPLFLSIWLRITIDLTNLFFFSLMWQSRAHRSWRKNWKGLLSRSDSYISLYAGIQFRRLSKPDVWQWALGFCSTAMQRWLLIPFPSQRLWCIRPIYINRHFFY